MNDKKYIVGEFRTSQGLVRGAIIFPNTMTHADVAQQMYGKITGAGFFFIDDEKNVIVYGRSASLNIDSRVYDAIALAQVLGLESE